MVIIDPTEVGEKLRKLRLDKGFTQEQVAKEISISRSLVSNIERGRRININNIVNLCNLYKVPLDYIIPDEEDKSKGINIDRMIKMELAKASLSTKEIVLKILVAFNK